MQKEDNKTKEEEKEKEKLNQEKEDEKKEYESELRTKNAVLIERKDEKKEREILTTYDLTNLKYLDIKTEEEKSEIEKLIKNILLSSNFSFSFYAFTKIFGYLKSLFLYNLLYFIGIKIIYKFLNYKEQLNNEPKAPLWKRLLLFNLPELIIIFYYHKRHLTKINTAIYSLFTYLSEKISYVFNSDDTKNFLCQVEPNNYNIFIIKKDEKEFNKESIKYLNDPEILSKETFFDSVIAYPNANFEFFDFNNLTPDEEEMYSDIFTLINEVEKKIKEECNIYDTIGTVCSNLAFNNSCNYHFWIAIGLKILSFAIMEIFLYAIKKRKRRKELFEKKGMEFNEKNMKKGYFLALNEYAILLYRIKEQYKDYEKCYNILNKKSQKLFDRFLSTADNLF